MMCQCINDKFDTIRQQRLFMPAHPITSIDEMYLSIKQQDEFVGLQ